MNVASLKPISHDDHPLQQLVAQEIDRQLDMVPRELAQYIDQDHAITEVMKLLSPLQMQQDWSQTNKRFHQTLNGMIADAATLSLIRLVCHT